MTHKIQIKEYAKRAGVSVAVIQKRIKKGEIKITAGFNQRGNPCIYIDCNKYVPENDGPRKPGCPRKNKQKVVNK